MQSYSYYFWCLIIRFLCSQGVTIILLTINDLSITLNIMSYIFNKMVAEMLPKNAKNIKKLREIKITNEIFFL